MPYSKRKSGDKWEVINSDTGDIKGTHDTEKDADNQLTALYIHASPDEETKAEKMMFIPIRKVNEERHEVYGWAAVEEPDNSDEIMDYATSKPLFQEWSSKAQKRSGGKSLGNVRAMHGNVAAGKLVELRLDDKVRGFYVGAKIVDDAEWKKVDQGVYTGFSIGGSYVKRWSDYNNPGKIRYTAKPNEISIVDSPCITSATFDVVKADGVTIKKEFHPGNGENLMSLDKYDQSEDRDEDGKWTAGGGGAGSDVPDAVGMVRPPTDEEIAAHQSAGPGEKRPGYHHVHDSSTGADYDAIDKPASPPDSTPKGMTHGKVKDGGHYYEIDDNTDVLPNKKYPQYEGHSLLSNGAEKHVMISRGGNKTVFAYQNPDKTWSTRTETRPKGEQSLYEGPETETKNHPSKEDAFSYAEQYSGHKFISREVGDSEKISKGDVMDKLQKIYDLLSGVEDELKKSDIPGSPEPIADIPLPSMVGPDYVVEHTPPPNALLEIKPNAEPSQEILAAHAVATKNLDAAMAAWLPKIGHMVKSAVAEEFKAAADLNKSTPTAPALIPVYRRKLINVRKEK